jgi:hypothetical protein
MTMTREQQVDEAIASLKALQVTGDGFLDPPIAWKTVESELARLRKENEKLERALWNAGICWKCKQEIQHDISEPFAHCGCPGTIEATTVPKIAELRAEIFRLRIENFRKVVGGGKRSDVKGR